MSAIRKAVFPAAGLGTRFLPATKAQPKEMLPVVDKPIIQYGVEEAVASGIDQIIVVTGRDKRAIVDHFDISFELEHYLKDRGKTKELQVVRKISDMVDITYIHQKEPLGLGHAVLMARDLVGQEPFAVFLADDIIRSEVPCVKQMMDVFEREQALVLALFRVQPDQVSRYGLEFEGTYYDVGTVAGFLKTSIAFALERAGLGEELRGFLKELDGVRPNSGA